MLEQAIRELVEVEVRKALDGRLPAVNVAAMAQEGDGLLSEADVAGRLQVSRRTANRRMRAGAFGPPVRIGRLLRVRREGLETFLNEQTQDPGPDPAEQARRILAKTKKAA